jgi:hypothetical protein
MGQAKLRKAEIAMLKAQPKQPKLIGFGAYYKDDADDGVSIMWNSMFQPQCKKLIESFYPTARDCFEAELKEFNSGNFGYFNGAISRETAIGDMFHNLQAGIEQYNIHCFGTSVRPLHCRHEVSMDRDLIMISMGIITNIWLLQELGEIPNNNFNGMNFVYVA